MRDYAPMLHGLKLAKHILGDAIPQREKAKQIIENYEETLSAVANALETKKQIDEPPTETETTNYGEEAVKVWYSVFADD